MTWSPPSTIASAKNAKNSEPPTEDKTTKEGLEALIARQEVWALIFGALVAIGVAGESVFGVRIWYNSRKLHKIERDENIALQLQVAEAKNRIAEANEGSLKAQVELAKLRKETEARRLTGEQKEKLRSMLQGHPTPLGIVSRLLDGESSDFADDLAAALHSAHRKAVRIANWTESKYGVFVGTLAGSETPEVKMLSDALESIGVHNSTVTITQDQVNKASPYFEPHVLYLLVGQKPPLSQANK
jgi:hypothetical protein